MISFAEQDYVLEVSSAAGSVVGSDGEVVAEAGGDLAVTVETSADFVLEYTPVVSEVSRLSPAVSPPDPVTLQYSGGRLSGLVSDAGRELVLSYDGDGRVSGVTGDGCGVSLQYDADGRPSRLEHV